MMMMMLLMIILHNYYYVPLINLVSSIVTGKSQRPRP